MSTNSCADPQGTHTRVYSDSQKSTVLRPTEAVSCTCASPLRHCPCEHIHELPRGVHRVSDTDTSLAETHTLSLESQRHKRVQIPECLKVTVVIITDKLHNLPGLIYRNLFLLHVVINKASWLVDSSPPGAGSGPGLLPS